MICLCPEAWFSLYATNQGRRQLEGRERNNWWRMRWLIGRAVIIKEEQGDRSYYTLAKPLRDRTVCTGIESHFWTKACCFYMQCHFPKQNRQFHFGIFHSIFHSLVLGVFCSCFTVYVSFWIDITEWHQFRDINTFSILMSLKLRCILYWHTFNAASLSRTTFIESAGFVVLFVCCVFWNR